MKVKPEYREFSGHKKEVLRLLQKELSLYQRGQEIRVGLTNNPNRRWGEHRRSARKHNYIWKKMVVVYSSSSHENAAFLERELINFCREKYPLKMLNKNNGGAGVNNSYRPLSSKYFVYFLLKAAN